MIGPVVINIIGYTIVILVLVGLATLPIWGPRFLRDYRKIRSAILEIHQSREACGGDHVCPFADPQVNELRLAARSRLGPRLSLIFCLERRIHECFTDWQKEMLGRLFSRLCYAAILCLAVVVLAQFREPSIPSNIVRSVGIDPNNIWSLLTFAFLGILSAAEVVAALEIRGRYRELIGLARQMTNLLI